MARKQQLPPTYLVLGLIGIGLSHFLFPGPRLIGTPWRYLGIPVLLFGAAVTVQADALFKKLGTEIKPFKESRLVVVEGPFRFSRHPMYLGFMCILGGFAILAGTVVPLLIVPVMFWLLTVRFVLPEEKHMAQQFGHQYDRYRTRVRRWF